VIQIEHVRTLLEGLNARIRSRFVAMFSFSIFEIHGLDAQDLDFSKYPYAPVIQIQHLRARLEGLNVRIHRKKAV
jgi:hypothetical protein